MHRTAPLIVLAAVLAACGAAPPADPVGRPMLPDLAPAPPIEFQAATEPQDGRQAVRFTSVLANVGEGDFLLAAERRGGLLGPGRDAEWTVSQHIPYNIEGAEVRPSGAVMTWGGDGHDHWHVERVAHYWLESAESGPTTIEPRYDTKVGFCFYDSDPYQEEREDRPPEAVHHSSGCGDEGDRTISMGMSVGWSDTYTWTLTGQEIEVTGLPAGHYRVWAEADPAGWFQEASLENNRTWADIELSYRDDGAPIVEVVEVGPDHRG